MTISVPGSDERKLYKATQLKADSIVLDLEDGVPFHKKAEARQLVQTALQVCTKFDFGSSTLYKRTSLKFVSQDTYIPIGTSFEKKVNCIPNIE
jgi:hypothetical protein